MYWNLERSNIHEHNKGLTLTWDVLKWQWLCWYSWFWWRLTLTWDVLKYMNTCSSACLARININMRCIEMITHMSLAKLAKRLTLTWDVLKLTLLQDLAIGEMININMRCIEIFVNVIMKYNDFLININMRCIEITSEVEALKVMED